MGRSAGCSEPELDRLARSWIFATEDPIGIDLTAGRFMGTMFDKFKSFAPDIGNVKQYGARSPKSMKEKWDEASADCQKSRAALRLNPSGVSEDQIISMAIAKLLCKRDSMPYEAKDYPHANWSNHLAFKVVRSHPKFADIYTVPSLPVGNSSQGVVSSEVLEQEDGGQSDAEEVGSVSILSVSQHGGDIGRDVGLARRPIGRKRAKRHRSEDRARDTALQNAENIAKSLRRRTELLEEKNAMLVYSRDEC